MHDHFKSHDSWQEANLISMHLGCTTSPLLVPASARVCPNACASKLRTKQIPVRVGYFSSRCIQHFEGDLFGRVQTRIKNCRNVLLVENCEKSRESIKCQRKMSVGLMSWWPIGRADSQTETSAGILDCTAQTYIPSEAREFR